MIFIFLTENINLMQDFKEFLHPKDSFSTFAV